MNHLQILYPSSKKNKTKSGMLLVISPIDIVSYTVVEWSNNSVTSLKKKN